MEEERDIPPILRAHFTEEEEKKVTEKIIKKVGLKPMRAVFPSVLYALKQWAKPAFVDKFLQEIPAPAMHLINKYYIPDFETNIRPKRDAPLLSSEPKLSRKGCFGLSFCFPCIL
jgi:hypothetical protein